MWLEQFRTIVTKGTIVDLGHELSADTPSHPVHTPFMFRLGKLHGDMVYKGGTSASNDFFCMGSHVGTHLDGLGHIAICGKIHGGFIAEEVSSPDKGYSVQGVETVAPMMGRGVLIDVAGERGVDVLPPAEPIGAEEISGIARRHNLRIGAGDFVFIRTGWSKHWNDRRKYIGPDGCPGADLSAAVWLGEQGIRATGSDTLSYEVEPAPGLPVHAELLVRRGIHIIEALNLDELASAKVYEFMFCALPLKIRGGTGSPIRPVAIY